jgi:hypothetical protein
MRVGNFSRNSKYLGCMIYWMNFGYFGHYFNWVTLIVEKDSIIYKLWALDKIQPYYKLSDKFTSKFLAQG